MALHLNLYHEIEQEKLAKQRDPLKLSLIGLGILAAILLGYYFWQLGVMNGIKQELARKQAEFAALSPKAAEAEKRTEELNVTLKTSELFVKRIEGRFYWAPLLELLGRTAPSNVQLTKLFGDLQGDNPRRCNLTLEGLAAGHNPREPAESFRATLEKELARQYPKATAIFRTLEDGAESVSVGGKPAATASFQISIQLALGEEVAAPAAPRRKKEPK